MGTGFLKHSSEHFLVLYLRYLIMITTKSMLFAPMCYITRKQADLNKSHVHRTCLHVFENKLQLMQAY